MYLTPYFSKTAPKPLENCIYTQENPSQPTACPPQPRHICICSQLSLLHQPHKSLEATALSEEMLLWKRGLLWREAQPPSPQAHQLGRGEDSLFPDLLSSAMWDCIWKHCSEPSFADDMAGRRWRASRSTLELLEAPESKPWPTLLHAGEVSSALPGTVTRSPILLGLVEVDHEGTCRLV